VVVNAVDRFGGTPLEDALRHAKEGAAALLREKGGCRTGDPRLDEVAFNISIDRAAKLKQAREPKIVHIIQNSQESNAFRNVGTKLSLAIAEQRSNVEPTVHRLIWGIKGLATRLFVQNGRIPLDDKAFCTAAEHVLQLAGDVRVSVISARAALNDEVNEDGPVDCILWKKSSTAYRKQAAQLDQHMRALLLLAKTARTLVKQGALPSFFAPCLWLREWRRCHVRTQWFRCYVWRVTCALCRTLRGPCLA